MSLRNGFCADLFSNILQMRMLFGFPNMRRPRYFKGSLLCAFQSFVTLFVIQFFFFPLCVVVLMKRLQDGTKTPTTDFILGFCRIYEANVKFSAQMWVKMYRKKHFFHIISQTVKSIYKKMPYKCQQSSADCSRTESIFVAKKQYGSPP